MTCSPGNTQQGLELLGKVYEIESKRLETFCKNFERKDQLAEDLVSDFYLKAAEKIVAGKVQFSSYEKCRNWCFRSIRHFCIDEFRISQKMSRIEVEDFNKFCDSVTIQPEFEFELIKPLNLDILDIIEGLCEEDYSLLFERYITGKELKEIAIERDCHISTICHKVSNARKRALTLIETYNIRVRTDLSSMN